MKNDADFKIKLPSSLSFDLQCTKFRKKLKKEVLKGVWLLKMELKTVSNVMEWSSEDESGGGEADSDSGGEDESDGEDESGGEADSDSGGEDESDGEADSDSGGEDESDGEADSDSGSEDESGGGEADSDSGGEDESDGEEMDFDGKTDAIATFDDIAAFEEEGESDSRDVDGAEQFISGVCIGVSGLIVTCAHAFESIYRDEYAVVPASVCGHRYNCTTLYHLEHVRTHGDLIFLRVVPGDTSQSPLKFNYVDVTDDLAIEVGSELLAIALNGDETFSGLDCFVRGDAGRINNLVKMKDMKRLLPNPDLATENDNIYLPIYGVRYIEHDGDVDNKMIFTTTCGSPIFDKYGRLVGVISMGIESKGLCFVTPFNTGIGGI